jgi:YbbR domain-containing protein
VSALRWFLRDLGTLLLAFALAMVVWISAVTSSDPNVERVRTVPLEMVGLDPNMLVVGNPPSQVRVTLRAPTSVSDSLSNAENAVTAWVDVTGLEAGSHDLEVQTHVGETYWPVRKTQVSPEIVTVSLEPLVSRTFPVNLEISGDPAVGYQKGVPKRSELVTVSGAAPLVDNIEEVLNFSGDLDASETIAPICLVGFGYHR